MVRFSKGDFLWLEPTTRSQFICPIGARVLEVEDDKFRVIDDFTEEQWLPMDRPYRVMHATSVQGVEDMISLDDLHEAALLRNLFVRYNNKLIYIPRNILDNFSWLFYFFRWPFGFELTFGTIRSKSSNRK